MAVINIRTLILGLSASFILAACAPANNTKTSSTKTSSTKTSSTKTSSTKTSSTETGRTEANTALAKQHQNILNKFPDVSHIDGLALSEMTQDNIVIFDVREKSEFEVSHIGGAIHVSPNISKADFLQAHGSTLSGRTAVFYCSVGQRSSVLAQKLQTDIIARGGKQAYNLEGGVFKWHNEARPLMGAGDKATKAVHPYNRYWGRMVNDKDSLRYTPAGNLNP